MNLLYDCLPPQQSIAGKVQIRGADESKGGKPSRHNRPRISLLHDSLELAIMVSELELNRGQRIRLKFIVGQFGFLRRSSSGHKVSPIPLALLTYTCNTPSQHTHKKTTQKAFLYLGW